MNHQKVYRAGMAMFALFNVMLLIDGAMELNLVGRGWEGAVGPVPPWAVPWVGLLLLGYTAAALAVLFVRRREAEGQKLTRFVNFVMLPAFPAGTLVGLYGLIKVDRKEFNLEEAIARWRRQLAPDLPVEKLERRLREETGDQMWSWHSGSEDRAFALAVQRLNTSEAATSVAAAQSDPNARNRQRALGWVAVGVVFPAVTLGILRVFDQIELSAWEQAAISVAVGLGLLLHFCTWRQLYRRLPVVTRRRAMRTLQRACNGLSLLFALLTFYQLLPGLNFSGPVSAETAVELKSSLPSIPLWCLCYLAGMGCLTLGCGLEEAVAQASGKSGSGGVAPAQEQT